MRYAARLARLEALVGKGAGNCPYCRLYMRRSWPDPDQPTPNPQAPPPAVYPECPMCGGRARLDLSEYADGELELRRIFFAARLEDFYRDERAWAAKRWVSEYDAALDARAKQRGGEPPYVGVTYRPPKQKESPEKKLYDRLTAESRAYLNRAHARLAAQYGKDTFPDLAARLAAVTHVDRTHLYTDFMLHVPHTKMRHLQLEEAAWLRCAEIERHVLGGVIAETQEQIDDCGRRALEMIEEARRGHEEYEEGARRRREEAERVRREREERSQACAQSAPAADESPDAALQRLYRKLAEFVPAYQSLVDTPEPIDPAPGPDDDRARRDREGALSEGPGAPTAPAPARPPAEPGELQRHLDSLLFMNGCGPAWRARRRRAAGGPRYPSERGAK